MILKLGSLKQLTFIITQFLCSGMQEQLSWVDLVQGLVRLQSSCLPGL